MEGPVHVLERLDASRLYPGSGILRGDGLATLWATQGKCWVPPWVACEKANGVLEGVLEGVLVAKIYEKGPIVE